MSFESNKSSLVDLQGHFSNLYRIRGHLSAGAHGIILLAVSRSSDRSSQSPSEQFAIKRILIRGRTIPVSVLREIKVLQYLHPHPNVIELFDVKPSGSSVNLIFPLLPCNLTTLIYETGINPIQCAIYFRMLTMGVDHLHHNGIVHRDLKPSNLLIDWSGTLKLCDFGQARAIDVRVKLNGQNSELSYQVCTRWYRAPELLYGSTSYSYDVDIWSMGCILAEMLQLWPLFKGDNDIEQLSLVVKALGEPTDTEWTAKLPDYNKIQFVSHESVESENDLPRWLQSVQDKQPQRCSEQALDLLDKLCRYTGRLNTGQVLAHSYLANADETREEILIRAKCVRHLAGPPKNES